MTSKFLCSHHSTPPSPSPPSGSLGTLFWEKESTRKKIALWHLKTAESALLWSCFWQRLPLHKPRALDFSAALTWWPSRAVRSAGVPEWDGVGGTGPWREGSLGSWGLRCCPWQGSAHNAAAWGLTAPGEILSLWLDPPGCGPSNLLFLPNSQ